VFRLPRPGTGQWRISRERWVLGFIAVPAWIGAFAAAAILWRQADSGPFAELSDFSEIFKSAYVPWLMSLEVLAFGFLILTLFSIDWRNLRFAYQKCGAILTSPVIAVLCAGVLYLEACAVVWAFRQWSSHLFAAEWLAFVFGPQFIVIAITLAIVIFLGLVGILSHDWRREWWIRLGSYVGIMGTVAFAAAFASIGGP